MEEMDEAKFFKLVTGWEPHNYQVKFLKDKSKRIAIRAGRKIGKTVMLAVRALYQVLFYPRQEILIAAPYLKQSNIIFDMITEFISRNDFLKKEVIRQIGGQAPKILFKNGGRIIFITSGRGPSAGDSSVGYNPNIVIIDEASKFPERAYALLEPSLLVTEGTWIISSTPQAKVGRFYDAFKKDSGYSTYHIPCSKCPHIAKEKLREEKANRTFMEYQTQIEGNFVEIADNYFSTFLINGCIGKYKIEENPLEGISYILAVDFARYGQDETVYIIGKYVGLTMYILKIIVTSKKSSTDATGRIRELHAQWKFDRINLDETGIGGGIADFLLDEGLPIIACPFHHQAKAKYYKNLKFLMERKRIKFHYHKKLIEQLKNIKFKYGAWGLQVYVDEYSQHDDYPDALALLCKDVGKIEEKEEEFYMVSG